MLQLPHGMNEQTLEVMDDDLHVVGGRWEQAMNRIAFIADNLGYHTFAAEIAARIAHMESSATD